VRLAFEHLNLRRNPFGELLPAERAALAVVDVPEALVARVRAGRFALLFVDPPGRGKTTHLAAVSARLPGAPLIRIPLDEPPPALPDAPVLLIDELHLVPPRARARLFARGPGLVATTHGEHARELARAGLAHEVVRVGGLTPARLLAVVERRVEWARRGPGPVPRLGPEAAAALVARHGDDLRAIIDVLYDAAQALPAPGELRV
jgi:hypothetical protein